MRPRLDVLQWRSVAWWLAVSGVVAALKLHYSTATAAELEWMLRPLSALLEGLTGHPFVRDGDAGWVSAGADVSLVKACAGINFMLMSLVGYAWAARPAPAAVGNRVSASIAGVLSLCTLILAAWATSLLANSLRIVVAMSAQSHGWQADAIGIGAADVHRLIGIAVYLSVLSLQLTLTDRIGGARAIAVASLLYVLLMVVVPLLTGNAQKAPTLFIEHLLSLLTVVAAMCGIAVLWHCILPDMVRASRSQRLPEECRLEKYPGVSMGGNRLSQLQAARYRAPSSGSVTGEAGPR